MIWGPFLLALALGIIVSAGLYFAYMWPQVEPDDEAVDAASAGTASTAPATDDKSDSAAASTDEADDKETDEEADGTAADASESTPA